MIAKPNKAQNAPGLPIAITRSARLATILFAIVMAYSSLVPGTVQGGIPHMDKLVHFLAYCILAIAAVVGWPAWPRLRIFWLVFGFGAIIELIQGYFVLGRTGSVLDALANLAGTVSGIAFAHFIISLFERHEAVSMSDSFRVSGEKSGRASAHR